MRDTLIMTPGPTYVSENVRSAMAQPIINPDIDLQFYEIYKETTTLLQQIMKTENDVLILDGEGILGLEASCASLIEEGDRVLVLSNGIFGEGFGDFVKMYLGECVYYRSDDQLPFDTATLRQYLEKDSNFKMATLVHCETPSGLVNPINELCPLLKEFGILTVVDAVSSIGGISIETDEWQIDILLGGSQKCLSAPPGLTFLSLSQDVKEAMAARNKPIIGFYCNLTIWDNWYDKKWFPYTQPVSDIYALRQAAFDLVNDSTVYIRHAQLAQKVRTELVNLGFELYPNDGFSNTVTAFTLPNHIDEKLFRQKLLDEYNVLIAGSLGAYEGKLLRIGHMGENCHQAKVDDALACIEKCFLSFS